jgi:tetratricopeptide (TPR) repeat protein
MPLPLLPLLWWLWLNPRRRSALRFPALATAIAAGGRAWSRLPLLLPGLRTAALACLILAAAYARFLGTPQRRLVLLLLAAHLAVLGITTHARNCLYARPRLLWEDAAKKYPDSYQAHYVLGNCYLNEDRAPGKALEEFRAAYRLRPQFPLLQLGFAKIFIDRGEYDRAEEALTRARVLDPDGGMVREGELCYIRGRLAQRRNDPQAALAFFRRSVACDPFIPAARKALGLHCCTLGMYAAAEEEFRRAAALDPGDAQAHFYLGLLYGDRGEYRPALEELELCLRLSPGNAAARQRSDEIRALLKNPAR